MQIFLTVLLLAVSAKINLSSLFPTAGPITGGTRVTIKGNNLTSLESVFPTPKCKFGRDDKVVEAFYVSCQKQKCLECISPRTGLPENVVVTVTLSGDFSDVGNSLPF